MFRKGNELAGEEKAVLRVLPADQCFGLHDTAGGEGHLRLVMQEELIMLNGVAQVGLEHKTIRAVRITVGGVECVPAAGVLGHTGSNGGSAYKRVRVFVP